MSRHGHWAALLLWGVVSTWIAATRAPAQPVMVVDPVDAIIRRTDPGNSGPIFEESHRLPDITAIRFGRFAPIVPWSDRFNGLWSTAGTYVRIEVEFAGLINPPGPMWYDDVNPTYEPFRHGPNPVCGWIEFDVDANEDTGGELSNPRYRYLGAVGRFGGAPPEDRFAGRAAVNQLAFDGYVLTPPYVERSGEEFHIALRGEEIASITVNLESAGGDPAKFEAGEIWTLDGNFFHRAHAFDEFAFMCVTHPGEYMPDVKLRFAHSTTTDRTTVSLVYPLTNAASAKLLGQSVATESDDGCAGNQNSIEEALIDLQFSAEYADPWTQQDPRFALMSQWATTNVAAALDPSHWRTCALVGACYVVQLPNNSRYAWTDVVPNPRPGDFNGDRCVTDGDDAALLAYIASYDGQPGYDADESDTNGELTIPEFSRGFSMFDLNYDGYVNAADRVLIGDMNGDFVVDLSDVQAFVLALLDPIAYAALYGGVPADVRGDLNCDGRCDGLDVEPFVEEMLIPRSATLSFQ